MKPLPLNPGDILVAVGTNNRYEISGISSRITKASTVRTFRLSTADKDKAHRIEHFNLTEAELDEYLDNKVFRLE
jgi:hypothetical protein